MFSLTKLRFVPARLRYALASRTTAKPRSRRKWVRLTLEGLEDRLTPSTLTVTSAADDGSAGTLRAALATANTDAAHGISDTINFAQNLVGATIVLTQGQLELSGVGGKITIDGSGLSTPVTISGNHASRVFQVDSGVQSEVDNLTITAGSTGGDGGAIASSGSLTISNSNFSGNSAASEGGAIASWADLTVSGSTFNANTAEGRGGAIVSLAGNVTISQSTFSDNTVPGFGGGAIAIGGANTVFTVSDSTFKGNSGFGGAILCGNAAISGCTFDQNTGSGAGAIDCGGTVSVSNSTFTGNSVDYGAGAIENTGALTVSNSTFSDNSHAAIGSSGNSATVTISNSNFMGNYNPGGYGGAIANTYGLMTLIDTTISGTGGGYGIYSNGGTLTVNQCDISSNPGGGIWNNGGNASVSDSTISDNSGGINNFGGSFSIVNSTLAGNSATVGAAIYNFGTLSISDCSLTGNSATLDGGAIYNSVYYSLVGQLTVTDCTFLGNSAGRAGGAIGNVGTATISNCSITGGSAWVGAGIDNEGTAIVSASTITDNSVAGLGGGGGGIANSGTLTITDSTLDRNSSFFTFDGVDYGGSFPGGGAVRNGGTLTIINSTLADNRASVIGGAIFNQGPLSILSSTLAGNSAGTGGGIELDFYNSTPIDQMQIVNTIIADNTGTDPDVAGTVTSLGYNLIGVSDGSGGWIGTDLTGTSGSPLDPLLAPLGNYGGPTQTIALLPGSPALDAGNPNDTSSDQRGVAVQNGRRDIGAFESHGFTLTASGGSGQATLINAAFANPLVATVTANDPIEPVAGGQVTFSVQPASNGAGATLGSPNPAPIGSNGQASITATANGIDGSYAVSAGVGDANVSFNLTNLLPIVAQGVTFSATAGAPFSGTVATFTSGTPGATAGLFSATITWGDGSVSIGTIAGSNGSFTVQGSHTYAAANSYAVTVAITQANTTATANSTANVVNLGQSVQAGQSATIGFWANNNGQALIDSFNGGSNSTTLADWLASSFPDMYGANAGADNLTGDTNAQVVAFYLSLDDQSGMKLDAQVLATALNVYATTQSLGGSAAAAYGFTVSAYGLGADSQNVGSNGSAFGVPNSTTLNVYQLLLVVDMQAKNGVLYNGETSLESEADNVFTSINEEGHLN